MLHLGLTIPAFGSDKVLKMGDWILGVETGCRSESQRPECKGLDGSHLDAPFLIGGKE
jgi:hypothetical protein